MNEHLQTALKRCSLHALLMVTSGALSRNGFGDIQILDRRQPKEKSRFGGHELCCHTSAGVLPLRIIVKVLTAPIRLRHLDEMAGAVDRMGADIGLVVSPYRLSGGALKNRDTHRKSRVHVFDGPILADLLMRAGAGVHQGLVDYSYFDALEEVSPKILKTIKELKHG